MNDTLHTIQYGAILLLLVMAIAGYALIEHPEPVDYAWVYGEPLEVEYWLDKNHMAKGAR